MIGGALVLGPRLDIADDNDDSPSVPGSDHIRPSEAREARMSDVDFGIQIEPQFGFTFEMIGEIASTAESLGFESLWVSDHFFMTEDAVDVPCLECWTILAALATRTENLRLGPMVAAQSFRTPALSANIAASLDHISDRRVSFGIGAGWKREEYHAYGYPFPKFSQRMEELEEWFSGGRGTG